MRLLSFDIECAKAYTDFSPICNFGYVIYDMEFNLIEKRDIIINPKSKFKLEGRKKQKDIKLFYPEDVYKKEPSFDKYYDEIKNILEYKDQIIVNHAVKNDIKYLANDCKRYKLPIINFNAYDTIDVYKALENSEKSLSLEKIVDRFLDVKQFANHKADEDADAAMSFFIIICKFLEVVPQELIELAQIKTIESNEDTYTKSKAIKTNKDMCAVIIKKYSTRKAVSNEFKNKKISCSMSLEKNIEKFENIILSIRQLGGEFTHQVSESDIFIYEKNIHCKRCDSFIYNISIGKKTEGINYDEYLTEVQEKILESFKELNL